MAKKVKGKVTDFRDLKDCVDEYFENTLFHTLTTQNSHLYTFLQPYSTCTCMYTNPQQIVFHYKVQGFDPFS